MSKSILDAPLLNQIFFIVWHRVTDFFEEIFINWQWYRKLTGKKYAFLCHKKDLFWSYNWESFVEIMEGMDQTIDIIRTEDWS
jgi:hypothetical protein